MMLIFHKTLRLKNEFLEVPFLEISFPEKIILFSQHIGKNIETFPYKLFVDIHCGQ
jgi:hypothetical protein